MDAFIERHPDLKNILLTAYERSNKGIFASIPGVEEFIKRSAEAHVLRNFWIGTLQVVRGSERLETSAQRPVDRIPCDVWNVKRISFTTVRNTEDWSLQFILKSLPPCEDLCFSQKESESLNVPQVNINLPSFCHLLNTTLVTC